MKKKFPPKKIFFLTFFLCNFSVRTLLYFQYFCFFPLENIKKSPSIVAHNRPQTFFFMYQTSPELIFHDINMSQDASVHLSVVKRWQYIVVTSLDNETATKKEKKNPQRVRIIFSFRIPMFSRDISLYILSNQ